MTRFGDELGGLALELAWSLWSELGVNGWARHHDWQAVDLEPLLLYTAWIGPADRRLQSRSIEWSIANFRIASAIRMRNLARRASRSTRASFGRYAATVKEHANAPWPASGDPLARLGSVSEEAPDLRRPSLVQLRLRALVGVSARAEILRLLLADPDRPQSAGQLAEGAAYGKGSVAQSLDMLTMAGFVQVHPYGNRLLYQLVQPAVVRLALQWLPAAFPDWPPILRITESAATYARSAPSSSDARVTRLRTLLHTIADDAQRLGIANLVPKATGPASIPEFEDWALTFVADQTGRSRLSPAASDVTYTAHHLSYGGWIGTTSVRGRQPRQLARTDRPSSRGLEGESGPYELACAMFLDVLDMESHKSGHAGDESAVPMIGREFADQILVPIAGGQEATFTAEFLLGWFENRRRRLEHSKNARAN